VSARPHGRAAPSGRSDRVDDVQAPARTGAAEMKRHVTMAKKCRELGDSWVVLDGGGRSSVTPVDASSAIKNAFSDAS
jgi:hypothetical protein